MIFIMYKTSTLVYVQKIKSNCLLIDLSHLICHVNSNIHVSNGNNWSITIVTNYRFTLRLAYKPPIN